MSKVVSPASDCEFLKGKAPSTPSPVSPRCPQGLCSWAWGCWGWGGSLSGARALGVLGMKGVTVRGQSTGGVGGAPVGPLELAAPPRHHQMLALPEGTPWSHSSPLLGQWTQGGARRVTGGLEQWAGAGREFHPSGRRWARRDLELERGGQTPRVPAKPKRMPTRACLQS